MTDIEILQAAIKKAKKNGFDDTKACQNSIGYFALVYAAIKNRRGGMTFFHSVSDNIQDSYGVIFSHEFAKAFFGKKDMWHDTLCSCGGSGHRMLDLHHLHCAKSKAVRDYEFHLQQLAIAKDRLKYLKKHL